MDAAEAELWTAYGQDRSIVNRNRLIERYLPWLEKVVQKYHSTLSTSAMLDLEDVISMGVVGLIGCLARFDINRGVKFETWAVMRVRGAIIDGIRDLDWVPRLERTRHPDGDGIQTMIAVDPQETRENEHGSQIAQMATTDSSDPKQDHFWRQICRGLSVKERLVLIMYWRLEMTMKQVGQHLGFSESRTSQIHSDLMNRLRERGDGLMAPRPGIPVAMLQQPVPDLTRRHVAKRKSTPQRVVDEPELVEFVRPDCSELHEKERLCMNIELVDREIEMVKAEIQSLQTRVEYLRSLRDYVANADPTVPTLMTVAEMERRVIETTLAREGGNRERTASALGIGIRTLCGKLREYGYPPRGNTPVPESVPQSASVA